MADDWQPGDKALCVGRGGDDVFEMEGISPQAPGPIVGLVYTVASVSRGFDCYGVPGTALRLVEIRQSHPRACGYNAIFFQKANALNDEERDEFLAGIKTPEPVQ